MTSQASLSGASKQAGVLMEFIVIMKVHPDILKDLPIYN